MDQKFLATPLPRLKEGELSDPAAPGHTGTIRRSGAVFNLRTLWVVMQFDDKCPERHKHEGHEVSRGPRFFSGSPLCTFVFSHE
jgi:hypothetical protein